MRLPRQWTMGSASSWCRVGNIYPITMRHCLCGCTHESLDWFFPQCWVLEKGREQQQVLFAPKSNDAHSQVAYHHLSYQSLNRRQAAVRRHRLYVNVSSVVFNTINGTVAFFKKCVCRTVYFFQGCRIEWPSVHILMGRCPFQTLYYFLL